jgi:hypothetical protein
MVPTPQEAEMTWGIPTPLFLELHVAISLLGIASGLIVMYGLLVGNSFAGWTGLFLATTTLTSITGFPLPPFGFDPPRAIGILLLVLMVLAIAGFYVFRLAGAWRWIFVVSALTALYLNVFVAVIQSFQKLAFLHPLAPTQSEPPFVTAQIIVLIAFLVLGFRAVVQFRPATG